MSAVEDYLDNVEATPTWRDALHLGAAVQAMLGLADWHDTKAFKARTFPGEDVRAAEARAKVHDDASFRIRLTLERHLVSKEEL